MTIYTCRICDAECKDTALLGRHLHYWHKDISKEEYANKYLDESGECNSCGTKLKFMNLSRPYSRLCNPCAVKESWKNADERKIRQSKMFQENNPGAGRPKGSKNRNKYPMSEAVIERLKKSPPPSWLGKLTLKIPSLKSQKVIFVL